jgi:hypothetical protein
VGAGARERLGRDGPAGLNWLFLFSLEFLIAFSFYFRYGFQIKFKPNSNSNHFKHVHQTKGQFRLSMAHIVLTK